MTWRVRISCDRGHEGWVEADELGYFTPPKQRCERCLTEMPSGTPKLTWRQRRKLHKQFRDFLNGQAEPK